MVQKEIIAYLTEVSGCTREEIDHYTLDKGFQTYRPCTDRGCKILRLLLQGWSIQSISMGYCRSEQSVKNLLYRTLQYLRAYSENHKFLVAKAKQVQDKPDPKYQSYLNMLTRMCTFKDSEPRRCKDA